eukprot:TRINITY_DN6390_c0_g1_i1.p2 TRINITY_DN6390_c0_g1~~TRINITY_DN6390_c0_g1_i1.p2  ORF type:complete len:178 (+),score=66.74 TRINITY_DN6390_c0_g1_i1:34-567(+)
MASKRVVATALDWAALASKLPAENKAAFGGLKGKVDKYQRMVNSLPETAPAIDFAAYKSKITVPGMVDSFAEKYGALNVPYPSDQGRLAEIDAQAAQEKARYTAYIAESNAKIAGYSAELAKWEAMMPVEEMNLEEALDAGLTQFVIDPAAETAFPHDQTWEEYSEKLAKATPDDFH